MRSAYVTILAAAALTPATGYARTFTHTDSSGAAYFAEVSDSRVVLRERDPKPNASRQGELVCPLSRDVTATFGKRPNTRGNAASVCVKFVDPACSLRRVDAAGNDVRHAYGFSSFCINMASLEQAQEVTKLINREAAASPGAATGSSVSRLGEARDASGVAAQSVASEPPGISEMRMVNAFQPGRAPVAPSTGVPLRKRDENQRATSKKHEGSHQPATEAQVWDTRQFKITHSCNDQMSYHTYGTACIVDARGAASVAGKYMFIRNRSQEHPLYYGLTGKANETLPPGEEVELSVRKRSGDRTPTQQILTVKWFLEARAQK